MLAAELGLFDGLTWQAAWSVESQYGKGLSNSLPKLQAMLRCAKKLTTEDSVAEKSEALSA